jgi:hypothetical protein
LRRQNWAEVVENKIDFVAGLCLTLLDFKATTTAAIEIWGWIVSWNRTVVVAKKTWKQTPKTHPRALPIPYSGPMPS